MASNKIKPLPKQPKNLDFEGIKAKRSTLSLRPYQNENLVNFIANDRFADLSEAGCVDCETEYLTPTGWKKISAYQYGVVAQYHPETREIEFVEPLSYIDEPCELMYHFKSARGLDQMLSGEHRVLSYWPGNRTKTQSANHVVEQYNTQVCGFRGKFSNTFKLKDREFGGLWLCNTNLRIQVAFIADGSFKGSSGMGVISLKKPRKIERLEELLVKAQLEYTKTFSSGYTRFRFKPPMNVKVFDAQFWQCNTKQLSVIADEARYWDGSVTPNREGYSFSSRIKGDADFVQFACITSGFSTSLNTYTRDRGNGLEIDYVLIVQGGIQDVGMDKRHKHINNVEEVRPSDGRKYCFEVPSSYLILRRNGKVFATGNTGKTPPACVYLYWLWASEGVKSIFTMPKSLLVKNYEELFLWSNFEPSDIVIVNGSPKQREKQINSDAKVFLCGFDCFATNWPQFVKAHPEIGALVGDEWHLGFSTHGEYDWKGRVQGTARTIKLYEFAKAQKARVLAMTGTLIKGRLCSTYPLITLIEPRYYGTYNNFLTWHAELDEYGKPFMWKNHERLAKILTKHSCAKTFKQAYGEENKQVFIELCTMGDKQRAAYDDMEEMALAELEDEFLEAGSPAVAAIRCIQFMQCPELYDIAEGEDGKTAHVELHIKNAIESGEPMVIFETTKAAQKRYLELARKFGARAELLNGDTSDVRRPLLDSQMRRGEIDVMVAAPVVAGVGFNWGNVNTMVFSIISYDDGTFIQNYRRAIRGKRETPLKIYVLQYRKSIDQRIAAIVNQKSKDRILVMGENDTSVHITQASSEEVL